MKVKSEREVTQSCPTLRDHMDCSLPGSSTHGIFQARVLEWVAIAFFVVPLGLLKLMSIGLVMPPKDPNKGMYPTSVSLSALYLDLLMWSLCC